MFLNYPMPIERKLAAIMFTDIVGYTEQMSNDENKAFALIKKKRDLLLPLVEKYEGKLIKEIGDGTLTRYFKADNAIDCASTFQSKTDKDLNVRAGIHTGEVIVDKEDVFGDVVNIASRLESIAIPGSILVSKETIDKLEMSNKVELVSLGMQSLKGVGRLIEVYAIKNESLIVPNPDDYKNTKIEVHIDDSIPSIAIFPFKNKGDKEDEFYAYGISEDLISDITNVHLIRVVSKAQISEVIKLSQTEQSQALNVRYISNGELWRKGNIFQLSIELYDTKTKKIIWSDRWQENWHNLINIKQNLSDGLLKALSIKPSLKFYCESNDVEAYEYYLKGKYKYERRKNIEEAKIAQELIIKAIEIDNNLIDARLFLGGINQNINNNIESALNNFIDCLELSNKKDDKIGIAKSLMAISKVYWQNYKIDLSRKYCKLALNIFLDYKLDNQIVISKTLLGNLAGMQGDLVKALKAYNAVIDIQKKLNDNIGIAYTYICMASVMQGEKGLITKGTNSAIEVKNYLTKAEDIAKNNNLYFLLWYVYTNYAHFYYLIADFNDMYYYSKRAIEIANDLDEKSKLASPLIYNGIYYYHNKKFKQGINSFEKSLTIQKNILKVDIGNLITKTFLFLCYKKLDIPFDIGEITQAINYRREMYNVANEKECDMQLVYNIYQLLDDKSYLETAYNQVQEKSDNLDPDVAAKFLSYPIPKAIVEEWEKVK